MAMIWKFSQSEVQAIALSVQVAVSGTLISLPFALWIGHTLARRDFYGKSFIDSIIHLPLVMPPVTTGYLLLLMLGSRGWIGSWLYALFGIRMAFSFYAAVIASTVVSFPLIVRSIRTAIEMVDTGLEDASRILGAGRIRTFYRVTLPLAIPGIVSGTVLSFARSLGEFGATITFAGNIEGVTRTLPLAIYSLMQVPGKEGATTRLVVVSIAISFIAMVISEWLVKKMRHDRN